MITIANQTVDANPDEIAITVPAYNSLGNYLYTIKEEVGTTQGVTYSSQEFMVEVMVNYKADGVTKQRQVVFYKVKPGSTTNEKIDKSLINAV